MYLALSPEEGRLLHLLARGANARRAVEFGASYGISTLYLGAALRANGGHLVTTEVHPAKCAALRDTLSEAGLADHVTLLEGDALDTLADVEGPLDLVLLDGWKTLYLPVFELLRPKLRPGALVLADNCDHEGAQSFVTAVTAEGSGCLTHRIDDLLLVSVLS
jgi:predicted O-methyltransferase YrrM